MSSTHETRLGELDSLLDSQQVSPRVAEELFALVDLLEAQPALRRALTDTGAEQQTRAHLVDQLFGGRISEPTHTVLHAAVVQRWHCPSGRSQSPGSVPEVYECAPFLRPIRQLGTAHLHRDPRRQTPFRI